MSKKAKASESKETKSAKASKPAAKGAKASKAAPEAESKLSAFGEALPEGVDLEELEEQQEEAAASRSSGGSAEAALAAAAGTTEMSASFKNFRHHPDMENFYRFIYDNDLRHEAMTIIDQIMVEKKNRKTVKVAKSQAH